MTQTLAALIVVAAIAALAVARIWETRHPTTPKDPS